MGLSDSQLMLLEQLTYADEDLFEALGIDWSSPAAVLTKVKALSYDDIYALSKMESVGSHTMTGQEWADILCAIKGDPDLMDLECAGYDDMAKGFCFVSSSGEAYVTFKGSSGSNEWVDNAEGLGMSDTPCQEWALDYIESLPYDNITVVGHSKGGNKAQYVTILSDKVTRCVSMDGQGFSKEFIEKYWYEIEQKGHMITNYSFKSDFVHGLMNYIPGAEQVYCDGDNTGARCHNPNGMLKIEYDNKNKRWKVSYEETDENPAMTYLHEFTCFIANNMPLDDRQKIGSYIGCILAMVLAGGVFYVNGVKYDINSIKDYILLDPDAASTILAYLMKYIQINHISKEEALGLLAMFGIDGAAAEVVWRFIDDLDLDGDHDIGYYLHYLNRLRRELLIAGVDAVFLNGIITRAKVKCNRIKINASTVNNGSKMRTEKKRNFSSYSLKVINSAIDKINSSTFDTTSAWHEFAGEEWYGEIGTGIALRGISKYFEKLYSVNANCKTKINSIYQSVYSLDSTISKKIHNQANALSGFTKRIISLSENIGN